MIARQTSRPVPSPSFLPGALLWACLFAATGSAQESIKLSGALAQPLGGNVGFFATSPDGSLVVYRGDQVVDELYELFSVPSDGSAAPVKISDPSHGNVHWSAGRVTPDGSAVLYLTEEPALFRAPLDGSSPPIQLAGGIAFQFSVPDDPFRIEITPDGQWVVYRENDPAQLWAVRADGSAPPVQLGLAWAVIDPGFQLASDGQRVVFRAGISNIKQALYSVPVDGSAAPLRLNANYFDTRQTVGGFKITPDAQTVVYSADQDVPEVFELYRVPIGGGAQTGFNGTLPVHADANVAAISPDSAWLLFTADVVVNERYDLYRVPMDASTAPVRLSGVPDSIWPNGVLGVRMLSDASRVLYLTSGRELYSVPLLGGTPLRLSQDGAVVLEYQITSTDRDVVFQAYPEGVDEIALFTVPPDGGYRGRTVRAPRIRRLATRVFNHFQLHPDGSTVTYLQQYPSIRLLSAPASGDGPSVELAQRYVGYVVAPGERVFYHPLPSLEVPATELYSVPRSGGSAVRLNTDLPIGPVLGRILDFELSPDGQWAVYRADGDIRWRYELYAGPTDGSTAPVQVSNETIFANGDVGEIDEPGSFRITPDSTRVVYVANHESASIDDLWIAPLDASAPALRLTQFGTTGGARSGFQLTPDGQHGVFLAQIPVNQFSTRLVLYSVRLDGTAPPVFLGPPAGSVLSFRLSPDSAHVVFHTLESATRKVLYSVPVEGGALVELHVATTTQSNIGAYSIGAGGARVVYLFLPNSSLSGQLYTIPIDGSAPRQRFGGLTVSPTEFELTAHDQEVVYSVGTGGPVYELYLAPIDASASLRLNPPLPAGPYGNFPTFRVSPDGTRVAYLVDQEVDGQFRLYSVPTDGSQVFTALTAPLPAGAQVWPDFRISPDSEHLIFLTDAADVGTFELYSVPLAGGAPAVRLNGPLTSGNGFALVFGDPAPFVLAGDRVAYALDQEVAGRFELYVAPTSGWRAGRRVNEPLQEGPNEALPFAFNGAGELVFLAPQDLPGVPELFLRPLTEIPRHRQR